MLYPWEGVRNGSGNDVGMFVLSSLLLSKVFIFWLPPMPPTYRGKGWMGSRNVVEMVVACWMTPKCFEVGLS